MCETGKFARWSVALLTWTLLAAGCQAFVDLDGLEDQSCPPGKKACNNQCVSERDIATGCGDVGCDPCAPMHADAICDNNNHCSFTRATCIAPWDDCNGFDDDGCETDTNHSSKHCGGCLQPCADPMHGTAGCSEGRCVIGKCADGWEDCDRDATNGCEHPIWTDLECASCGIPCPDGTTCDDGICRGPISR